MIDDLIDLYYDILQRDNANIPSIIFKDDTYEPYFNADVVADLLGDSKIFDDIDKFAANHYSKLKYIVEHHRNLYPNTRGKTIFLDEMGLFLTILNSKQYGANLLKESIAKKILPSIRRFGEFKIGGNSLNSLNILNEKINLKAEAFQKMEDKILTESEQKNLKSKYNGAVYFLVPDWGDTGFSHNQNNILFIKFSEQMDTWETRNGTYILFDNETYNMKVIKTILVNDYRIIEDCFRSKLEEYGSEQHKDLFECTYDEAIETVADCVKCYDGKNIDKYLDINIGNYSNRYKSIDRLNENKKMKFYIVGNFHGNNSVNTKIQKGGYNNNLAEQNKNYYDKYIKYKQKYLELRDICSKNRSL